MSEKIISIEDLLLDFNEEIENETEILLEIMGNFCSSLGYLTKNISTMEDKKKLKLLKFIRISLKKINDTTFKIAEILSNNNTEFLYRDFLNGYENELLYPNDIVNKN